MMGLPKKVRENVFSSFDRSSTRLLFVMMLIMSCVSLGQIASASSFGAGYFGANVPFGTATNIAVSLSGNVNFNLTPSGSNFTGSTSSTITVTTDDVNGYYLYTYCYGNSALVNGSYTIPASANVTEGTLASNTWGYNIDGSSNYIGFTTNPVVIATATGPYISGNTTTITYGVLTTDATPDGSYSAPVTFTAAAMND
jgi:hypothetical protein